MTTEIAKGHCKHGEFRLAEGCQMCIAEYAQVNSPANIAKRIKETDRHKFSAPEPLSDEARVILTGGRDEMIADATESSTSETALIKVNPEQDTQVLLFLAESNKLRDYAEARVISTVEDLRPATDDLSLIANIKKGMEEKRKEYLKPLQDHVKSVNEAFKTLMAPIEDADKITRTKILAFKAEMERKAMEAEEINRLRMEAAKKEMDLKGELTESVNLVETPMQVPAHVRTDSVTLGTTKVWKFEVTNASALPEEYKMPESL